MLRPPPERHALPPLPSVRCRAPYLSKDCRMHAKTGCGGGYSKRDPRINSDSLAFSKCLHALKQLIAISARALVVVVRGHKCAQKPAELRQLHQFPALLAPDPHCLRKKKKPACTTCQNTSVTARNFVFFRYPHSKSNGCRHVRASFVCVFLASKGVCRPE